MGVLTYTVYVLQEVESGSTWLFGELSSYLASLFKTTFSLIKVHLLMFPFAHTHHVQGFIQDFWVGGEKFVGHCHSIMH